MKKIWKTTLTEDQKQDVINIYQSGKNNIAVLAARYNCGVKQIMEILDNAGIERKRNKKQIADGWKEGEKRPDHFMVTVATPEYISYLTETLAVAGRILSKCKHVQKTSKKVEGKTYRGYIIYVT